ncbi:MAG TPA: lipoprotein insertase outer membrane protein LolB [Steroidobacteraceae bacterium]|nr:lipoprotein insertase outer membrane protein LolB [Steroidobacteraceae bacterium]
MRISAPGLGALMVLALLAGCRTLPPPALAPGAPYAERRPQLQALTHFQLKGRVALSANGNGFNANLRWLQDRARSQVSLEGPLGVGGMQITADGDDLDIVTSKGERISNQAAHAELIARLGFDVPLESLRYWVLGVPDPGQPAEESLDPARQRLAALAQDGWHVTYTDYTSAGSQNLPARLTLERDAVRVRVFIENWQL